MMEALIRRAGTSASEVWWDHSGQAWVASRASASPVPLAPGPDLPDLSLAELLPSASRGTETHYVIEVTDTATGGVDTHVVAVADDPMPGHEVVYDPAGPHGPTAGTRTLLETGREQAVSITYDSEGRRALVRIEDV